MAKNGANRALRAGLKAARRGYRAGLRESAYEYDLTMNAGEAAAAMQAGNLTRYARVAAGLDKAAVRSLRQQVTAAKRSGRKITADEAKTIRQYGSAMGGVAAQQYAPAEARGAAGVAKATAAATQGVAMSRATSAAGAIAQEGVQAQQAAAEFAFAQALQARNSISAETLANLTGTLYGKALDYQYQLKLMKAQAKIAEEAADKEEGVDKGAVHRLTAAVPDISQGVADIMRDARDAGELKALNITDAATQFAAAHGYSTPAELEFITTMMQKMQAGVTAGDAVASTIDQLYGGYKGFDKWGRPLQNAATSATLINQLRDSFAPSDDRESFAPGAAAEEGYDDSTQDMLSTGGGALAGAVAGTAIFPGVGTVLGAIAGGIIGNEAGTALDRATRGTSAIREATIRTLMEQNGMTRKEAERAYEEAT